MIRDTDVISRFNMTLLYSKVLDNFRLELQRHTRQVTLSYVRNHDLPLHLLSIHNEAMQICYRHIIHVDEGV